MSNPSCYASASALTPEELNIIRQIVGEQSCSKMEKREFERVPFTAPLLAAPYNGFDFPSKFEFHRVLGRDVSRAGISFFYPEDPPSLLAIVLGKPGNQISIGAAVVHKREGFWDRMRQFVVGCHFKGRIEERGF